MRQSNNLQPLGVISATGGGQTLDIRGMTRIVDFIHKAKSSAGTSPTLAAKLQQSAAGVLAYSFAGTTTPSDNKVQSAGITKQDAAWTQSGAASVRSIFLSLKKNGTIAAGKKVNVDIFADSAGAPTGSSLGQAIIDIDSAVTTAYTNVEAQFNTPVDVADATVYHAVITADYTASDTNNVTVQGGTVSASGNQSTYTPSSWTAVSTVSLLVLIYTHTYADVSGGGFTGLTTVAGRQVLSLPVDAMLAYVRLYYTIGGTSSPAFYCSAEALAENRLS